VTADGAIAQIGRRTVDFVFDLGRLARFSASVASWSFRRPFRLRRFFDEMYDVGVLSLAIIGVSGVAVGMVLGLQGYNTLVRFGAEESLGAVVGLSLVRELGPVLTALLVAGRAGHHVGGPEAPEAPSDPGASTSGAKASSTKNSATRGWLLRRISSGVPDTALPSTSTTTWSAMRSVEAM
jgi:hypothetical protein